MTSSSVRHVSPVLAGRHDELTRLTGAHALTAAGDPAAVLVGGEAGVGKSRLVAEFVAAIAGEARVLTGGCVDLGGDGLPFAPFVAALRHAGLDAGERERLAPLLPGHAHAAPNTQRAPESDDARPRLFEGLLTVLARLAAETPLVLVLEDLHWADRSSRDLLDFLVRNQNAAPGTLLIGVYRSDGLPRTHPLRPLLAELTRLPWVDRLELPRLRRDGVVRQMHGILGHDPDPELLDTVFTRSEGNPLFVEALLEGGTDVPASLADLLLSTVERLPGETRQALRVAAVGGVRVSHALLSAVHGQADALRPAVDASVLLVDGDDYVFRHALIRDAVYASLLPGERTALHAGYAAVLTDPGELAYHLSAAGDTAGALSAAWQASRQARRRLAYAEELRLAERILELWDRVPDGVERVGRDHASLLEQAAQAAARAGEHQRGERHATAALSEIDTESERVRTAMLLDQRAQLREQLGMAGALEDHREAVRLVPESHEARPYLLNSLADHLMRIPLPDEARRAAEEALRCLGGTGDDPAEASALITLAVLDARLGDLDAQLPNLARARAVAEGIGADGIRLRALHAESHLLLAFGRTTEAEELARRGLAVAREAGLAHSAGALQAINVVNAQVAAGRWDEALETAGHALEVTRYGTSHATLLCFKAFVCLHRGDTGEAERALDSAHAHLEQPELPQDPLLLPRLDAELRLAQDRVTEAAGLVDRALDLPHLSVASRFTWPLLAIGARVAAASPTGGALLARLREQASTTRVAGPVQAAGAALFAAEAARAEGRHDVDDADEAGLWAEAVSAWEPLGQPLRLAQALLGLAEARLATGGAGRDEAAPALRRAAALAEGLGAAPLLRAATEVARSARITLSAEEPRDTASHGLTARELEILGLVAEGLSNREIAARLFIAAKTASVHVSNILGKLGAANRVEAAALARRRGLLQDLS